MYPPYDGPQVTIMAKLSQSRQICRQKQMHSKAGAHPHLLAWLRPQTHMPKHGKKKMCTCWGRLPQRPPASNQLQLQSVN